MSRCDHWGCRELPFQSGVVLSRNDRITQVAFVETVVKGNDASVLQTMRVIIEGNRMNPTTAVAVATMLVRNDIGSRGKPYSPELLDAVKNATKKKARRSDLVGRLHLPCTASG